MNNKKNKIELLAPAKNLECGLAAINYGADAIYIGASKFGARTAVGNSIADIESLVNYAHKFWAKVYVTMNTILYDNELEEVRTLIYKLNSIGVDALIIQDMALLEMDLPPIPLFASTQTHNYSVDKIKFLEQVGFQRIILARELSLVQIDGISQNTNVDLECFVHGALCVSMSGQCYFSHSISGRSANRGECLQACRMTYSLEDRKGKILVKDKYLLSLKDLNLSNSLEDLIKAGISSFKIEGRLKDINYVKNVTGSFRQKLDKILEGNVSYSKSSSGKTIFNFTPSISKTFNRSYSDYFINYNRTKNNKLASFNTPKARGESLGKVKFIGNNFFILDRITEVINGDGLCFITNNGDLSGFNVSNCDGDKIYYSFCNEISIGTDIFRNFDLSFSKILKNNKTVKKVNLFIKVFEDDSQLNFNIADEDNVITNYSFDLIEYKKNSNKELALILMQQMRKSGNTIFNIEELTINVKENYNIPLSKVNEIRRELFKLSEQNRRQAYQRLFSKIIPNSVLYPENNLNYKTNITNKLAEKFYKRHNVKVSELGFELGKNYSGKEIMICKYCIKDELNICPVKNKSIDKMNEPLYLKDSNRKYKLEFDCANCIMKIIFP